MATIGPQLSAGAYSENPHIPQGARQSPIRINSTDTVVPSRKIGISYYYDEPFVGLQYNVDKNSITVPRVAARAIGENDD